MLLVCKHQKTIITLVLHFIDKYYIFVNTYYDFI